MRTIISGCLLLALLAVPLPAAAQSAYLNAGVFEEVGVPGGSHGGLYPNIGLSLGIPVAPVTLSPWIGVEKSDLGNWGFAASFTADYPVSSWVGLDAILAFQHDQDGGNWSGAGYYAGAGGGLSVFLEPITISVYANYYAGLNVSADYFVPGLNVAYTLPL